MGGVGVCNSLVDTQFLPVSIIADLKREVLGMIARIEIGLAIALLIIHRFTRFEYYQMFRPQVSHYS